jgi:hypothetical protein
MTNDAADIDVSTHGPIIGMRNCSARPPQERLNAFLAGRRGRVSRARRVRLRCNNLTAMREAASKRASPLCTNARFANERKASAAISRRMDSM